VFALNKKAGHMGATAQLCVTDQKVLANGVPSTHGILQPSTHDRGADKADIQFTTVTRLLPFRTPSATAPVADGTAMRGISGSWQN
jgi:hypothetical protein